MTTLIEGNILALNRYKKMLEDRKVNAKNEVETNPLSLPHALWMINEALSVYKKTPFTYPLDKYSRWLGFIQAILVMHKVTTVNNERNVTRPWFKGNDGNG